MTTTDTNDFEALAASIVAKHASKLDAQPPADVDPPDDEREVRVAAWVAERDRVLAQGRFPARARDFIRLGKDDQGRDLDPKQPAISAAREFSRSKATALVLLGGTGAGKTVAATWLARRHGGARPGFVRTTALASAGLYGAELHEWIADRTMLVLDDLGAEFADGKGVFASILDGLVDLAYGERQRIVFTSNLPLVRDDAGGRPSIVERVGARVWSRWCEDGQISEVGMVDLRRGGR